jgi:hypothetical protein
MRSSPGSRLHAGSTSGNSTVEYTCNPRSFRPRSHSPRSHNPRSHDPRSHAHTCHDRSAHNHSAHGPRSFFPCSFRAHLQGSRTLGPCALGSCVPPMLAGLTLVSDPRSLEPSSQSSPCALKEHGENECLVDSGLDGGHGDGGRLQWTRRRQTRHRRTRALDGDGSGKNRGGAVKTSETQPAV